MVEACLLSTFPEQVANWHLNLEADTKQLLSLYSKHVPDGNIMKVTAIPKEIDDNLFSTLSGFISRYAPVIMLLARDSEKV